MCEDYPCCGHDQGDCPNLDFWVEEELSPEEQAKADRAYYRQQEQEAYAEFLMSPYCFD